MSDRAKAEARAKEWWDEMNEDWSALCQMAAGVHGPTTKQRDVWAQKQQDSLTDLILSMQEEARRDKEFEIAETMPGHDLKIADMVRAEVKRVIEEVCVGGVQQVASAYLGRAAGWSEEEIGAELKRRLGLED